MNVDICRMHEHRHRAVVKRTLCNVSMIIIKLACGGAPNRPSFPPRNRALNVKGGNVIEVRRRNSVIEISTCLSIWTVASAF